MKTKLILLGVWAIVFPSLSCLAGDHFLIYSHDSKDYTAVLIECSPLETGEIVIPEKVPFKVDPDAPFPDEYTVVGIGPGAFRGCVNVTSVKLPSTIRTIGDRAFEGCSKVTSIELPSDLNTVGMYAFFNSGLTSVTIPGKVNSIGDLAFTNMKLIRCLCKNPPEIKEITFCVMNSMGMVCANYDTPLYVPKGCKEDYQKALNWRYFTTIREDGNVALGESLMLPQVRYVDGQLTIPEAATVMLYTMEGKLIATYRAEAEETYNLSMLNNGIYIVRVKMGDKTTNIKIAK